jgi:hypothetical protein
MCTLLKTLQLNGNKFLGSLPSFFNNFALTELYASTNSLSGLLPNFGNPRSVLFLLDLSVNGE